MVEVVPIVLKYAAGAVLFATASYFAWHDKLEKQYYGLILAGCFAAIGVNIALN
jgi:hypothetical protein